MVNVKEMPYSEKYALVEDYIKFEEEWGLPFVQKHLGNEAVAELQKIWQEVAKPVPENASDEEKYEAAYSNWISMAKSLWSLVREKLGEDGVEKLKLTEVEALKRKNASPALFLLKLIRAVSPGTAFAMTAKQFAYQLQWITPFSTDELTKNRAVYSMPSCKILDYPDTEDLCLLGCQGSYRQWFYEQFKVKQEVKRQGNSCIMTITPLR